MSNRYRSFTTGLSTLGLLLGCSDSSDPDGGNGGAAGNLGGSTSVATTRGGAMSGGAMSGGTTNNPNGGQSTSGGTTSTTSVGGTNVGGTTASTSTGPTQTQTCPPPASQAMPEASLPQGYCAWVFAEGLTSPRGMVTDDAGQLVLIESGSAGAVTLLWDENGDHINQPSERMRIASTSGRWRGGGVIASERGRRARRWCIDGGRRSGDDGRA